MIKKFKYVFLIMLIVTLNTSAFAAITDVQGNDVAEFAKNFIEKGNERRDEKGYPLLTYAIAAKTKVAVEIRNSGYNEKLYCIEDNSYYSINGKYLYLGDKWCMDCGTFVTYTLHKTLGLDLYNESAGEPWHVQDLYNDAEKGEESKYFEFVYKQTRISEIDFSKLKKGDVIARVVPGANHGMIYVGDEMIAHANRDMIKYTKPYISGFQVGKIKNYYLGGTRVNVLRIKDGVVPRNLKVNSILTWPDNGEIEDLLNRPELVPSEKIHNGEWLEEIMTNDLIESGDKIIHSSLTETVYKLNSYRLKQAYTHIYRNNQLCLGDGD